MGRFVHRGLRFSVLLGVLGLAATPALATTAIPIPEPSTLSLIAAGVAGLVVAIRARRRK